MQNYKKSYIIFSVILGILNIRYFDTKFLVIISWLQYIYIVILLIEKKIKKAYIYHVIFILSSSAFPVNLEILSENGTFLMNTYSKLKILGPISLSYLGNFSIVGFIFLNEKNQNLQSKFTNFFKSLCFISLIGVLIGLIGILTDKHYNFQVMISRSIYSFNLILNLYIIKKLFSRKELVVKKLIYSLLIASPLITLCLIIMGYSGKYGGVVKYPVTEVFSYSIVLLLTPFYEKKYKLEFIVAVLVLVLGRNSFSGKDIIIVIATLLIFLYKALSSLKSCEIWKKNRAKKLVIIIFIFMFMFINSIVVILNQNNVNILITHKIKQVLDLFQIFNFKEFDILKISSSPRVRIGTILNTFETYKKNPFLGILGSGYGGYYRDFTNSFNGINLLNGGFSKYEVNHNIFYNGHDTFASIFLTNGLLGIYFVFYWCFQFIKKIKKNNFAIISFLWLFLVYGFSHHISLFASLCIFITLDIERRRIKC